VTRATFGLAFAVVLSLGCGPGRFVRRGALNEDALAVVRARLPEVRGLDFTAQVPALAMSPAELQATIAHEVDETYAPGDLARIETIYARLGLLPAGVSLRGAIERLYDEEGAGFYDPRTKRLMLATGALRAGGLWVDAFTLVTGRDLAGEMVVAHELTHALQDQHWSLPTTPEPLTDGNGDKLTARHALLEGDATLAGFAYVLGGLDDAALDPVVHRLAGLPTELAVRYPDVPEVVRATLAFQYDSGSAFTAWALRAGGWAAVDRAEGDPPESTEQVLHPVRYFGLRDSPVAIALGGTESLERAGWTRTLEDTLGELQLRVLAARFLDRARAARVADGWGGDRLRALTRGDALVLVWMTAWDSLDDAAEFAAALPEIAPEALVERRDDRVLVLLGPAGGGGPDLDALARRVWSGTTLRRPALQASR
jgi:hypothetical protein